jgi:hypothetical protein
MCSVTHDPSGSLRARFGADMRCRLSIRAAINGAVLPA